MFHLGHLLRSSKKAFVDTLALVALVLMILMLLFVIVVLPAWLSKPVESAWQMGILLSRDNNYQQYQTWDSCQENSGSGPDWRHIATFGNAPTFCPCPLAWKDETADYVWWLA